MIMSAVLSSSPEFHAAVEACAAALQRVAESDLSPAMRNRLHALGARKDLLNEQEHAELMALVDFANKRQVERLESQLALNRLRDALPDFFPEP
jgi:hypothetical protein